MRFKLFMALMCLGIFHIAQAAPQSTPRAQYETLMHALKQNQPVDMNALHSLQDYPLYPFLQVEALKRDIRQQSLSWEAVLSKLSHIPKTPLHGSVTDLWFQQSAQHERWHDFLNAYNTLKRPSTRWQCYATWAHHQQSHDWEALAESAESLWLVGHSQVSACDRVFDAWFEQAPLTDDLIWQRLQKTWPKNPGLSQYLIRHLDESAQKSTYEWIKLAQHPKQFFNHPQTADLTSHPLYNHFLFEAWKKISYQDPLQATQLWATDQSVSDLTTEQQHAILKSIALYLLVDGNPDGFEWADKVPERTWSSTLYEWVTRVALLRGEYARAEHTLYAMPTRLQQDSAWQYWKAWLLTQRGETQAAEKIWQPLSEAPNLYGLLAQSVLHPNHPTPTLKHDDISMAKLVDIKANPTFSVIQELRYHEEWRLVRQVWRDWIKGLSQTDKVAASKVAAYLKWYDLSLYAINRTSNYDRHEQSFPLAYYPLVQTHLDTPDIHPAWIMSIMKQESGFSPHARSYVGAKGLMQLMPKTADYVAKNMLSLPVNPQLLANPDVNIALGTTYFEHLVSTLHHPIEAVAAYNAGPNALSRWEHREDNVDPMIWIENIPFSQTRTYVKKVLYNYWMYEATFAAHYPKRYGQQPHSSLSTLFKIHPSKL